MHRSRWILPTIIFSQFAGTSFWFAGNAILDDLSLQWQLPEDTIASITSAVQLGFIFGTLVFAFLSIPDRFSPRKIFLFCAFAGALANATIAMISENYWLLLCLRFLTGFFIAGLYPVGMKIAAGWYQKDLGKAIGFLVGALVLGTAFPHLLSSLGTNGSWQAVILGVSALAVTGGLLMFWFVPDGPYLSQGTRFNPNALIVIFRSGDFRASAFGYFGHMWELYAFWAFVPVFLSAHLALSGNTGLDISFWTFAIIAIGFIGCAGGGLLSLSFGSARVAVSQLSVSGLCCLFSPLLFFAPTPVFIVFLMLWGLTVAGDSPQFSALNAATAPKNLVGSALTIANCIGFSITIVSISLLDYLADFIAPQYLFFLLTPGPVFGLLSMRALIKRK